MPTAILKWVLRSGHAILNCQLRSGDAHCDEELPVEVRRCPLRSRAGTGSCGGTMPTAIKSCQLRPGGAHCDPELARTEEE